MFNCLWVSAKAARELRQSISNPRKSAGELRDYTVVNFELVIAWISQMLVIQDLSFSAQVGSPTFNRNGRRFSDVSSIRFESGARIPAVVRI